MYAIKGVPKEFFIMPEYTLEFVIHIIAQNVTFLLTFGTQMHLQGIRLKCDY